MSRYRKVRVSKGELRRRFTDAGLETPEANGYTVLPGDSGPAGPDAPPDCSCSQTIVYLDPQGDTTARALVFYRPDGSIGGSGKPDPKRVLDGGTIYIVEPPPGGVGHRRRRGRDSRR